jgi:BMFP domain-containing protein YqiC
MSENNNEEIYNNVLAITRDQLSKSMSLATELEALLMIERKKTSDLEAQIAELNAASEDKKK